MAAEGQPAFPRRSDRGSDPPPQLSSSPAVGSYRYSMIVETSTIELAKPTRCASSLTFSASLPPVGLAARGSTNRCNSPSKFDEASRSAPCAFVPTTCVPAFGSSRAAARASATAARTPASRSMSPALRRRLTIPPP
eukprot:scaffold113130_cov31-Tisochrysis_lutea.AAC.5